MQGMAIPSEKVTIPIKNHPLRRLTIADYEKLHEQEAFEKERVELVFGQVVAMSPIGEHHAESTARITAVLIMALRDRAHVFCQAPLVARADSMPQPDIYVARDRERWSGRPTSARLVVEVAKTSLSYDSGEKALLYALSDVDEYWVVDLVNGLVEVRRERDEGVWRSITTYRRGQTIALLAFPDVTIDVSEILPPP